MESPIIYPLIDPQEIPSMIKELQSDLSPDEAQKVTKEGLFYMVEAQWRAENKIDHSSIGKKLRKEAGEKAFIERVKSQGFKQVKVELKYFQSQDKSLARRSFWFEETKKLLYREDLELAEAYLDQLEARIKVQDNKALKRKVTSKVGALILYYDKLIPRYLSREDSKWPKFSQMLKDRYGVFNTKTGEPYESKGLAQDFDEGLKKSSRQNSRGSIKGNAQHLSNLETAINLIESEKGREEAIGDLDQFKLNS